MTIGRASSPAPRSTAGRLLWLTGVAVLGYSGARCHSLGPVVTGVGGWPPVRPAGWNGNDGRAA